MPARELPVDSKCFDFHASVLQEIEEQFLRGGARRCTGSPREVGRAQNKEKSVSREALAAAETDDASELRIARVTPCIQVVIDLDLLRRSELQRKN
eukprot:2326642-Rhodomonas_salina.1